MIIDGSSITQPLSTDVCIVGSGAAGVTLAWYLQKAGIDVVLAEAGRPGANYKYSDKDIFYYGETLGRFSTVGVYTNPNGKGQQNTNSFLTRPSYDHQSGPSERERTYGGTTAHFGGQSRPLDPVVLKAVPGYPAWPITIDDLTPYFGEAASFCRLHNRFDADYWAQQVNGAVPQLENFNAEMYQFIGPNEDVSQGTKNFATRKFDGITIGESNARVIQNANLKQMEMAGAAVQRLHFASLTGGEQGGNPTVSNEFTVQAKVYVLATGAVENARQMLLAAIPNDNIGRYFMCHPLVAGYLDGQSDPIQINYSGANQSYLSGAEQGLMDGHLVDGGVETSRAWRDDNGVTIQGRFIPNEAVTTAKGIGRCWFWAGGGASYFEQAPNKTAGYH